MYLGDHLPGQPVKFPWSTNAKTGGATARSVAGSIRVYKGGSTTEFTSGVTDTANFDAVTGLQYGTLDTTDPFYVAHEDYSIALIGAIIDGETVNAILACFSILNRGTYGLMHPGVVTSVTSTGMVISGISLPSNRLRSRQVYSGYGASVVGNYAVIATHTLSAGSASVTFTQAPDAAFAPGDRVLVM